MHSTVDRMHSASLVIGLLVALALAVLAVGVLLAGCDRITATDATRACAAVAPAECLAVEAAPATRCADGARAFEVRVAAAWGSRTVCCTATTCTAVP